jgi:uridine kinase
MLDDSVYLDVPHEARYTRRVHFKNSEYETKVLIPMQEQFVEPTKKYAHYVLDVSSMDAHDVYAAVERIVEPHLS